MKTKFLTLVLLCISIFYSNAYAQDSKKGRVQTEVELSVIGYSPNISIGARTGYLFNESFFVGGGIGLGYDLFVKCNDDIIALQYKFFASCRYSLPISKIVDFSLGLDGGGFIEHETSKVNYLVSPRAGFGFKMGQQKKNIISIYANYSRMGSQNLFGGTLGFSF